MCLCMTLDNGEHKICNHWLQEALKNQNAFLSKCDIELAPSLDGRVGVAGEDSHDPLGPGAVGDADVGVVVGPQLLDVGAALADDAAGDLARHEHPRLELVPARPLHGALVAAGRRFNRKIFDLSFGLKNGLRFHFDSET